ncbi:hypothetical protein OESDEN_23967 [Oesophagostomum dentatum]|uniref:Uncharacterized protein n=1 Tax=Oesophagostomum dentatum TaxID=61180 RepID=A0A0B1RTK4_OESDE|nr:hypothetical protein OESDEN_23967 [Oesophagostomum dentatum]
MTDFAADYDYSVEYVGHSILKNSLFSLEREKMKQAFIRWLQLNPLREEDLLRVIFWVFPGAVSNICDHSLFLKIFLDFLISKPLYI